MMADEPFKTLLTGLAFGESPRWHDGRLWVADWSAHELVTVDPDGNRAVNLQVPFAPFTFSIDWLPDGRLLIVSGGAQPLLRQEPDGSLVPHADLAALDATGWNEIVVDGRGNAYCDFVGFNLMTGEPPAPGSIALARPDGSAQVVADGLMFPNGMAVTADGGTLIVAESYANQLTAFDIAESGELTNRRIWAKLGDDHPDGICIDAQGAVWFADVSNKHCVRVREGGEVLQTVSADRGCFACTLGGEDGRTLFIVTNEWHGPQAVSEGILASQVVTAQAPSSRSGRP
jgi:sugar lactone lactonase YvrE